MLGRRWVGRVGDSFEMGVIDVGVLGWARRRSSSYSF